MSANNRLSLIKRMPRMYKKRNVERDGTSWLWSGWSRSLGKEAGRTRMPAKANLFWTIPSSDVPQYVYGMFIRVRRCSVSCSNNNHATGWILVETIRRGTDMEWIRQVPLWTDVNGRFSDDASLQKFTEKSCLFEFAPYHGYSALNLISDFNTLSTTVDSKDSIYNTVNTWSITHVILEKNTLFKMKSMYICIGLFQSFVRF